VPAPAHVVTAVGSGGTAAGLLLGLELAGLTDTIVVGVVVNDKLRLDERSVRRLAGRAAALLRARGAHVPALGLRADRLMLPRDWLGPGYGHATADGDRALELARDHEGLELEPVYTGKALAAVLALGRAGRLASGPTLYLNTNGPR
jgi:D-cysteine desulfhydrase